MIGTLANSKLNLQSTFTFTDKTINEGLNYYRIKQVDIDGNYTYSKTIAVHLVVNDCLTTLSPNPAINFINVVYPLNTVSVRIYDMVGRNVYQVKVGQQKSSHLNISNFSKGKYNVEILTTSDKIIKTFIKL